MGGGTRSRQSWPPLSVYETCCVRSILRESSYMCAPVVRSLRGDDMDIMESIPSAPCSFSLESVRSCSRHVYMLWALGGSCQLSQGQPHRCIVESVRVRLYGHDRVGCNSGTTCRFPSVWLTHLVHRYFLDAVSITFFRSLDLRWLSDTSV